jgi:hypothetical protein
MQIFYGWGRVKNHQAPSALGNRKNVKRDRFYPVGINLYVKVQMSKDKSKNTYIVDFICPYPDSPPHVLDKSSQVS